MVISNITPPQVWSASSRSLTNFGSGALTPADTISTTIAANSQIDLRTSAGIVGLATIAIQTGAAATGSSFIQLSDGTTKRTIATTAAAANAPIGFTMVNTNSVGANLLNSDASVAGTYMVGQFLLTI